VITKHSNTHTPNENTQEKNANQCPANPELALTKNRSNAKRKQASKTPQ
jgi:hypothetical protein